MPQCQRLPTGVWIDDRGRFGNEVPKFARNVTVDGTGKFPDAITGELDAEGVDRQVSARLILKAL